MILVFWNSIDYMVVLEAREMVGTEKGERKSRTRGKAGQTYMTLKQPDLLAKCHPRLSPPF
jgi:hypothetical protein